MKIQTDFSLFYKLAMRLLLVIFTIGSLSFQGQASEILQDPVEITGTVLDANTGEALPGVTVTIKGTTTGTITDFDGLYTITASSSSVLQFSFVGYLTEEITVGASTTIDVSLVTDIIGLDEVVVTGYGVQKKSDITGSIASVSGEELNKVPVPSVDQALQGLAAGVNVIPVSGRPGDEAVIHIRGISSINGVEPLVIIDGMRGNLYDISPSEIESVEVLKDASSAAIYGDSGGNGVILITTKKGRSGKMITNFNMYQGFEMPVSKLDLMNSEQWLQVVNETETDEALPYIADTLTEYDWQDIMFEPAFVQNYNLSAEGGNDVSTYNVSASYLKQPGIMTSALFERFTFRINSDHKLNKRLTFDEKVSFTNRKTHGLDDWRWNHYYDGPVRDGLGMVPFCPPYNNADSTWGYSKWGNTIYNRANPLAQLEVVDRVQKVNRFNANLGLKLDIVKGLSFTTRFGGMLGFWDNKEYQNAYDNTIYDRREENAVKLMAAFGREFSYTTQLLLEYKFSIAEAHNVSLLGGMEATRDWYYDYNGERNMAPDLPDYLKYFSQSTDGESINQIIDGFAGEGRSLAYLGRINYDYKEKYLLTANVRYSGRSNFGPDYRWGLFPSFGVGWKFTEEGFMQNQGVISFGKIRFGYGEVGTYPFDATTYPYESFVRSPTTFAYPINGSVSSSGAAPVQIPNSEIHWETIIMSNVGIDLAMFNNRLSLTAEYYNKLNEDMLMLQAMPYHVGTYTLGATYDVDETDPRVNIGSIRNSGFEFTVGYKNNIGDLNYNVDLHFSTLKNEVVSLATDSLYGGEIHGPIRDMCLTRVGGSVSEFNGWMSDGIFTREDCAVDENGDYIFYRGNYIVTNQPYIIDDDGERVYAQPTAQPGDTRWVDVNGDGEITNDDRVSLGSPLPKVIYGFSINLEYKGIDLLAHFTGTIGNKIFNGTKQYLYQYHDETNRVTDFANRYVDQDIIKPDPVTGIERVVVPANLNGTLPRNHPDNYERVYDFYVEDGSYFRLRNLTIGYTLPRSLTKVINVERFRVYVGARNLFTITSYTGINPEIGSDTGENDPGILDMGIDASIYPVTKMFLWGVNLTF